MFLFIFFLLYLLIFVFCFFFFFFFKQKTAYEMRISDWSSDVCSSDLYGSFGGVDKPLTGIGENIRNAAWLLLLFAMLRRNGAARGESLLAIGSVYAAVAGIILLQTFTDLIWRQLPTSSDLHRALLHASLVLHLMTAIGSLMLVHHLYVSWPVRERQRVELLLGALAAMWTYDLNLYAIAAFAVDRAAALQSDEPRFGEDWGSK